MYKNRHLYIDISHKISFLMYKNRHSDVKRSIKEKPHRLKICQVFNLAMNNDAIRDNGCIAGTPDSVPRDP